MQQCSSAIVFHTPAPSAPGDGDAGRESESHKFVPGAGAGCASSRNLKTLLSWVLMEGEWRNVSNEMAVEIRKAGPKKKPAIYALVDGPERTAPDRAGGSFRYRRRIIDKTFPGTEDGLLEAIVFLKKSVQKYRTEGTCDACPPSRKRLKADGMPKCEYCTLKKAIGV